ncbi:MAG: T9SS type A sorting domain-containing protein [Saprospiraceae bacterium]
MKSILLFSICLTTQFIGFSQGLGTYQDFNINVDNQVRTFKLYTPPGVDAQIESPLVMVFHGFSMDVNSINTLCEFYDAADTANFYLVYPQGLPVNDILYGGGTRSGWAIPNSAGGSQDDVKFVNAIIDTLETIAQIKILENQIYAAGFSLGGEFAYYLGCNLSDRIAAIAAVSSAMIKQQIDGDCLPVKRISALQMVGTNDPFYPFQGNAFFYPFYDNPGFWSSLNDCDADPEITRLEDKDPTDGSTVDLGIYQNCSGDLEVLSYRINNGQHAWPGGQDFPAAVVNFDIDASDEIWKFFNRHTLDEKTTTVLETERDSINVYPNPFYSHLSISLPSNLNKSISFEWYNSLGQLLEIGDIASNIALEKGQISFSQSYLPGIYYLKIKNGIEVLKTFRLIKVD